MNSRERVLTALALKEPDRVPFVDWIDDDAKRALLEIMGENELDDAAFARRLSMDALVFYSDLYLAPQFCEKIIDAKGRVHLTGEGLIKKDTDLNKMILPDLSKPDYLNEAKRYIDKYGQSDLAIFCGLRSGMMNTIFSMGLLNFSYALHENVKLVETILDRFVDWNCELVEKLQPIGFDAFVTYDDIAYKVGPMFSPQVLREIFLPRIKRLVKLFNVPWIYHSDGNINIVLEDLLTLGMNGMNPFEPPVMDIESVKENFGERICLWGNIDLVHTLPYGSTDEVEAEVRARIKKLAPGGGYILGTANSITAFCRPENIIAMAKAKNSYGMYPIN